MINYLILMVNLLKKYQNYLTVNAYPRNITFCVDTKSAKTYLGYTVSIFLTWQPGCQNLH